MELFGLSHTASHSEANRSMNSNQSSKDPPVNLKIAQLLERLWPEPRLFTKPMLCTYMSFHGDTRRSNQMIEMEFCMSQYWASAGFVQFLGQLNARSH